MECLYVYRSNLELLNSASRLAQLVERETVNLEVVGSIPILRAFCSDEVYFYCRIRAIPFVAQKMPSSHYYYYCLYYILLGVRYQIVLYVCYCTNSGNMSALVSAHFNQFRSNNHHRSPFSLQTQWYLIFSLVCLLNQHQHEHEHPDSSVGRV